MSFLDSIFANEKTTTAYIELLTQPFVDGELGKKKWTPSGSFECLFWRGSTAERYVSDQYKAIVAGLAVARPEDLEVSDIPESCRIKINDIYYAVIYPDDIAEQGEVIQIPLKKWVNS